MSLTQHICARWDDVAARVVSIVTTSPPDAMACDLIICESDAISRALTQAIASDPASSQICAGIRFVTDNDWRHLLWPVDSGTVDPWAPSALAHTILDIWSEHSSNPIQAQICARVFDPSRPSKKLACALYMAQLFSRYARAGIPMLHAWREGHNVNGAGQPLPNELVWQPDLWRRCAQAIGTDPLTDIEEALATIDASAPLVANHQRIMVVSTWEPGIHDEQIYAHLSRYAQVHTVCIGGLDNHGNDFAAIYNHRTYRHDHLRADRVSLLEFPSTRLGAMQARLHGLKPESEKDSSFAIHRCGGLVRQVEVLRDGICNLLMSDRSIQPRSIAVVSPHLDDYIDPIEVLFSSSSTLEVRHPGQNLPIVIASSSRRSHNQSLDVLEKLIELYRSRACVEDLREFIRLPGITAQFGFSDDDLDTATRLIDHTSIDWGIDTRHRHRFHQRFEPGTWFAEIERMLVSMAFSDLDPAGLILEGDDDLDSHQILAPLPDISSGDSAIIGRLAEIIARIRKVHTGFSQAANAHIWHERLVEAIDLLCGCDRDHQWHKAQALSLIHGLIDHQSSQSIEFTLVDIAYWLDQMRSQTPGYVNYGNGAITFADWNQLHGLSYDAVFILGLNDSDFPTSPSTSFDDLLAVARDNLEWIHDPYRKDQQALVDLIVNTRKYLTVITDYTTREANSSAPLPSVCQHLLDLAQMSANDVIEHRCVPWDPEEFVCDPSAGRWGSFDLGAARLGAACKPTGAAPRKPGYLHVFDDENCPEVITLDDLADFFAHPARFLLKLQRGMTLPPERPFTKEIFPLGGSDPWKESGPQYWRGTKTLYEWILHNPQTNTDLARDIIRNDGIIMPLEKPVVHKLDAQLRLTAQQAKAAATLLNQPSTTVHVHYSGRLAVTAAIPIRNNIVLYHGSRWPKAADIIRAWIALLLLSATGTLSSPQCSLRFKKQSLLTGPDRFESQQILDSLIDLYCLGRAQVVPIFADWIYAHIYTGFESTLLDQHWSAFYPDLDALNGQQRQPTDPVCNVENLKEWVRGLFPTNPPDLEHGYRYLWLSHWLFDPITSHLHGGRRTS